MSLEVLNSIKTQVKEIQDEIQQLEEYANPNKYSPKNILMENTIHRELIDAIKILYEQVIVIRKDFDPLPLVRRKIEDINKSIRNYICQRKNICNVKAMELPELLKTIKNSNNLNKMALAKAIISKKNTMLINIITKTEIVGNLKKYGATDENVEALKEIIGNFKMILEHAKSPYTQDYDRMIDLLIITFQSFYDNNVTDNWENEPKNNSETSSETEEVTLKNRPMDSGNDMLDGVEYVYRDTPYKDYGGQMPVKMPNAPLGIEEEPIKQTLWQKIGNGPITTPPEIKLARELDKENNEKNNGFPSLISYVMSKNLLSVSNKSNLISNLIGVSNTDEDEENYLKDKNENRRGVSGKEDIKEKSGEDDIKNKGNKATLEENNSLKEESNLHQEKVERQLDEQPLSSHLIQANVSLPTVTLNYTRLIKTEKEKEAKVVELEKLKNREKLILDRNLSEAAIESKNKVIETDLTEALNVKESAMLSEQEKQAAVKNRVMDYPGTHSVRSFTENATGIIKTPLSKENLPYPIDYDTSVLARPFDPDTNKPLADEIDFAAETLSVPLNPITKKPMRNDTEINAVVEKPLVTSMPVPEQETTIDPVTGLYVVKTAIVTNTPLTETDPVTLKPFPNNPDAIEAALAPTPDTEKVTQVRAELMREALARSNFLAASGKSVPSIQSIYEKMQSSHDKKLIKSHIETDIKKSFGLVG